MENQEQCDRMKQLCVNNGLIYWPNRCAFEFRDVFDVFCSSNEEFFIHAEKEDVPDKVQVTESEFINLLKEYKDGNV